MNENEFKDNLKVEDNKMYFDEEARYNGYKKYIDMQKEMFFKNLIFLDTIMEGLKISGTISEKSEIKARIKSYNSVKNKEQKKQKELREQEKREEIDETVENKKINLAVLDVFAVQILTETEEEYVAFLESIQPYYDVTEAKNYNKSNGYRALHRKGILKTDGSVSLENNFWKKPESHEIPFLELHAHTKEVYRKGKNGTASHYKYKGENKIKVFEKYNNEQFDNKDLPEMFRVKDAKIIKLTKEEILKELYPFLFNKTISRKNNKLKIERYPGSE